MARTLSDLANSENLKPQHIAEAIQYRKFKSFKGLKKVFYLMKIVFFTGAGISAESGISTFRDANGLWRNHQIEEVASPSGWRKNPGLVLEFYNERRNKLYEAKPNKAHTSIAKLEGKYDVTIITQNVDDLHEQAGSQNVIHLHGELKKARSSGSSKVYDLKKKEIAIGDLCEAGYQLRPHIVWFGENVLNLDLAYTASEQADIFVIVGTSLKVQPAASLILHTKDLCRRFIINKEIDSQIASLVNKHFPPIEKIFSGNASEELPKFIKMID